jgi:hypothetical protein
MAELKPCPFCGGEAHMKIIPHIPRGYDYTPQCSDPSCCGRITKYWQSREVAEYAWNRRSEEPMKTNMVTSKYAIEALHDLSKSFTEEQWKRFVEDIQTINISAKQREMLFFGERKDNGN